MEDLKDLFARYRKDILEQMPFSQVEHVGGSSIPGAYTKGDLDIQIRVKLGDFEEAVCRCDLMFARRHDELWNNEFALFIDPKQEIKVDIMLTVIDSAYDNFYKIRDALISDPALLERYTAFKKQYPDLLSDEYRSAKRVFFRELERELGLKERPQDYR